MKKTTKPAETTKPVAAPVTATVAKTVKKPAPVKTAPAVKKAVKPVVKPVVKTATVAKAAPVAAAAPAPAPKVKVKLVRDSFTMPRNDYDLIAQLKDRTLGLQRATKKSELLRAGLQVLAKLSDKQLLVALNALTPLKAGRPKAD